MRRRISKVFNFGLSLTVLLISLGPLPAAEAQNANRAIAVKGDTNGNSNRNRATSSTPATTANSATNANTGDAQSPVTGLSDTPAAAPTGPAAGDGPVYEMTLARLLGRGEPMYLRSAAGEGQVLIPVSARMKINSLNLHLEFTNSISLLPERSQLVVSIDDVVVKQFPLRPAPATVIEDIALPVNLLTPGYRRLKFRVAQHYTLECENPAAPELWTQIDTARSRLTLRGGMQPLSTPTLARLGDLVDEKLWGEYAVNIVTAHQSLRDEHLRWGSLVAQGMALRLKFKPLQLSHVAATRGGSSGGGGSGLDQTALKGRDNVFIGTSAELSGLLPPDIMSHVGRNGFVGVFPLAGDPAHFVAVISGGNDEDVTRAATAFPFMNFPFPDAPFTEIAANEIPKFPAYAAERSINVNATYPFTYFGAQTTTLRGMSSGDVSLEMNVPADLFARETSVVELSLHFSYGAALRNDSVLNIMLNDRFENVVHLGDGGGAVYRDYKISIPLRSFRAGRNELTLAPNMTPLVSGKCEIIQDHNLQFTLFDDSTLTVPNAAHYVRMPNLKLLQASAFPFAKQPDGAGFGVHVLANDSRTIAAAWMLTAKLAQVSSVPLYQTTVSFGAPEDERHWLLVGPVGAIDRKLLAEAPLNSKAPFTTPLSVNSDEGELTWPGRIVRGVVNRFRGGPATSEPQMVRITQSGGFGEYAALMQFESSAIDKTITIATADNAERLSAGVNQLVQPEFWSQMQGDYTVWRDTPQTVRWQLAGPAYYEGDIGMGGWLEYLFSHNPVFWSALFIILIVGLALLTRHLLRRYRTQHHEPADDLATP